jgi:hypothetical protein
MCRSAYDQSYQEPTHPAVTGERHKERDTMLDRIDDTTGLLNPIEDILILLWKEQCRNARRYILDNLKRRDPGAKQRAEGVHLMLLSVRDQFTVFLLSDETRLQLKTDSETVLNLLNQF